MIGDFITWIKAAFEGIDGKTSHQKLLILYMTLLFTFVVISTGLFGFVYPDGVYQIMGGVIIGQSAIRAWQITKDHRINTDLNIKKEERKIKEEENEE